MHALAAFRDLLAATLSPADLLELRQSPCSVELVFPPRVIRMTLTERGDLHLSTPIFYNFDEPIERQAQAIARFNGEHLFRGGYCLCVEEASLTVRLEQIVRLDRVTATNLPDFCDDWLRRATACARWYQERRDVQH